MSRTPSQKRYCAKRGSVLTGVRLSNEERTFIVNLKSKQCASWLKIIYRGLGIRREDYLNSRKKQD